MVFGRLAPTTHRKPLHSTPLNRMERAASMAFEFPNIPVRDDRSAGQARAISLPHQARTEKPTPPFLRTDPGKDPDDLCVLLLTKHLQ